MSHGLTGIVAEVAYPDPFIFEEEFVGVIQGAIKKYNVDAVMPVHEEVFVLAKHRHRFQPTLIIAPDFKSLMRAQDKYEVFRIATALSVATPLTFVLDQSFSPRQAAEILGYPFVVKPRFGSGASGVIYVRREVNLANAEAAMLLYSDRRLIAQQWVPGHGVGIGALVWGGRLTAASGHKRLREIPIQGGTSTARITYTPEILLDAAALVLAVCGLEGVAMVEFRVDEESGKNWLLEVNPRYWGGLPTGIASGVNFPLYHVACATGKRPKGVFRPSTLVESRWLLGELRAFLDNVRAGHFAQALAAFRVTTGAQLVIDDFGPAGAHAFFHQLSAYLSNLVRHRSMGGHSDSKSRFFELHTTSDFPA